MAGLASWGLIRLDEPPARPAQPVAAVAAPPAPQRVPEVPIGAARPYDAAPPRLEWLQALANADATRGERVMREGLDREEMQACTSCHGVNGKPVAGSRGRRLRPRRAAVRRRRPRAAGARLPELPWLLDLVRVAEACGGVGWRVERPEQVEGALRAALASSRPALVEAVVANPNPAEPAQYKA